MGKPVAHMGRTEFGGYVWRDRLLSLPVLNKRLDALNTDIRKAEEEAAALLDRYERESRDVVRIRAESFSAFLYKLVGKYGDRLEKEQSEEIDAKIAYDRAAARLNDLSVIKTTLPRV